MNVIDDSGCGVDGSVVDLNSTIDWDECMKLRARIGEVVPAGPTVDYRPVICDRCIIEHDPDTVRRR